MNTIYRSINASYAASKTILPGLDYSINPYFGCEHGCIYCYSMKYFITRKIPHQWGRYVELKSNLTTLLSRQLEKIPEGSTLGLGTATDPYQPAEATHRITRRALSILLARRDLRINIQTKSTLVLRDMELVKKHGSMSLGFTILTTNDAMAKVLEPRASPPSKRLEVLRRFSEEGVDTWIFIGPILPYFTDSLENSEVLIRASLEAGVKKVYLDKLRFRAGVRENIVRTLQNTYPYKAEKYKAIMRAEVDSIYKKTSGTLIKLCTENGIVCEDESEALT